MPRRTIRVASALLPLLGSACSLLRPPPAPTPAERALARADSFRATAIRAGVRYLFAWQREGPWAIHLLEVGRGCRPIWQARKSGPPLADRATTSALGFDALAAVNADFFELPRGTPVGAHVANGQVLVGPGARPVVVGVSRSRAWIDATVLDARLQGRRINVPIAQVNRARPADTQPAVRLFTHWFGPAAPTDSALLSVRARIFDRGRGVVELIDSAGLGIWLDTTHVIFHIPRNLPVRLSDTLEWTVRLRASGAPLVADEALGGFPWLRRNGQDMLPSQSELRPEFSEQRHPRTAFGLAADGTAFLVVVDGRQPPFSDGMTLRELNDLMRRLGATDALNLDGGGSSTLTVLGRVLNRPSDATGERPVANVLALQRCR